MKKKIKHLFILLTPFQKTVINQLFEEKLNQENSLILLSEYVNREDSYVEQETLKNYEFSRERLFKEPFKYFKITRANVKEAKDHINALNSKFDFSPDLEIYLGTDKDVFTQLFLNDLFKNGSNRKLTLVDEGIGYYVKSATKDKVISIIYRLLTPMFFGSKLLYIKQLGVHPKIKTIYLRAPELLKEKRSQINYIQFNLDSKINMLPGKCENKVLLYSFPNQDYDLSTTFKVNIIKDIALHLKKFNRELIIKPHPRENTSDLEQMLLGIDNIRILDHTIQGESLNYFEYELILNFFSSIIIDLIDKKFPKEKIFTIGFTKNPIVHFDGNLNYCYIKDFKASKFINFH